MTIEEQIALVQKSLREAMKSYIGAPPNIEEIKNVVATQLSLLLNDTYVGPDSKALAELMVIEWLPYEQRKDKDLKAMIRALPKSTIDWFVKMLRGDVVGIPALIYLEQMYRDGHLGGDWECDQSPDGINAKFTPKKPIEFIKMDFVIKPGQA